MHTILSILAIPFISLGTSYDCGSPWFSSKIRFSSDTLSKEFLFEIDGKPGIRNSTIDPLVIINEGNRRIKIVKDEVYYQNSPAGSEEKWVKDEFHGWGEDIQSGSRVWIDHTPKNLVLENWELHKLKGSIQLPKYRKGSNRPVDIAPPLGITFHFGVEHKGAVHDVTGTITYTLNVQYDKFLAEHGFSCTNDIAHLRAQPNLAKTAIIATHSNKELTVIKSWKNKTPDSLDQGLDYSKKERDVCDNGIILEPRVKYLILSLNPISDAKIILTKCSAVAYAEHSEEYEKILASLETTEKFVPSSICLNDKESIRCQGKCNIGCKFKKFSRDIRSELKKYLKISIVPKESLLKSSAAKKRSGLKVQKSFRLDPEVRIWLEEQGEKRGMGYQTFLNWHFTRQMTEEKTIGERLTEIKADVI